MLEEAPVSFNGANDPAHGFGSLKAVLGGIFDAYVHHEVCLQHLSQNSLTNPLPGKHSS